MKNIFIAILMFFSCVLYAQDNLKFMNISMGEDIDSFVKELEKRSFVKIDTIGEVVRLNGEFAGRKDCILSIHSTKNRHVWKVMVIFPPRGNWLYAKSDYGIFCKLYESRYGQPDFYESFSYPYTEGDGREIEALNSGACVFISFFRATGGIVSVEIGRSAGVIISYEDSHNVFIKEKERNANILKDI